MKRSIDNFLFLKKYQELQLSIAYDILNDLGYATIGYSQSDPSIYWNNALTNLVLTDSQVKRVEDEFTALGKRATFYFEDSPKLSKFISKLESKNYTHSYSDSWLFWNEGSINSRYFDSVKKVNNKSDLEIFLSTFNDCYQDNDPQNPYGEQSGYIESARSAWINNHINDKIEYFIICKDDKPVAVSSLTNQNGIGYISNVGSLKEVRGEGYGKAATLFCVNESQVRGNKVHCLATEEDSYPNEFYNRIGFELRFKAVGYTKGGK